MMVLSNLSSSSLSTFFTVLPFYCITSFFQLFHNSSPIFLTLMNVAFFIDFLIYFLISVKMKYLLLLCAVVVAVHCIVMPVQRNALDCQMCELLVKAVDGTADRDTKEIEKVRLASCMPDPLVFFFPTSLLYSFPKKWVWTAKGRYISIFLHARQNFATSHEMSGGKSEKSPQARWKEPQSKRFYH